MNNPILYFLSGMLYSGNWFGNLSKVKQLKVRVKIYVCVNFRDSFPTFDFSWCLSSRDSCCQFKSWSGQKSFWGHSRAGCAVPRPEFLTQTSFSFLPPPEFLTLLLPNLWHSLQNQSVTSNHPMQHSQVSEFPQKWSKRPPSCVLVTLLTPQCGVPSPPRERWTQKDWYDPTNVLNVHNSLKKVEHNGADKTEIKSLLYSRYNTPPAQLPLHDPDVTEYSMRSKPASSADLFNFKELVRNVPMSIWTIGHLVSILYESELFPTEQDVGR